MTIGRLPKKEIERRERIQQKKDLFEKLKNKANKLLDSDSMGVSE